MITREEIEKALPPALKSSATQSLTDMINNISNQDIEVEQVTDNFITYSGILKEGNFTAEQYFNAITYVTFKLMNLTNLEAYSKTFPQRHTRLIAEGRTSKEISAYVAAYHKGKLVNKLMEQVMVPTWVVNQQYFQEAIHVQVDLMRNANSEKVRSDAANSVLTHLSKPKETGPLLAVNIENKTVDALSDLLVELAGKQREAIQLGHEPAKEIAALPLFKKVEPINGTD